MRKRLLILFAAAGMLTSGCERDERLQEPVEEPPVLPGEGPIPEEMMEDPEPPDPLEEGIEMGIFPSEQEVTLPEGIPVPDEYIVLSNTEVGPMRITTLEVGEDLRELVDRFNRELEDSPHEVTPLSPEETEENLYEASGRALVNEETRVTITVSEYDEGAALREENTGTVTYQITGAR